MKIAVIDDYQNAFKTLACYPKLNGHEVISFNDPEPEAGRLAERLKDFDVVVLTQQRSSFLIYILTAFCLNGSRATKAAKRFFKKPLKGAADRDDNQPKEL